MSEEQVELEQVKQFVNEQWQGSYTTQRERDYPDGCHLWSTTLHGPDGRRVFTKVMPDGTLVDMTRTLLITRDRHQ